ncbi:MAG: signal peptidase I [Dethiobacter sp.]|jgi:signal peptidase|nr:signal peptidase I [Dethiobacter sp.]MBS3989188.1 signal peptidase I [Dethiobacter sp.]
METAVAKQFGALTATRKVVRLAGQFLLGFIMLLMAVLVFSLLQSRIAGVPAVAGYKIYIVLSGSMSPAFEAGSVVLVRPIEATALQVGDIITYHDPDPEKAETIVTHRVIAVQPTDPVSFITRGDANDANDPLPLPAANLIGRVDFNVPHLGFIFSFVRTRMGIILLVIVPAVLIIATELRKLMGYAQALEREKQLEGGT